MWYTVPKHSVTLCAPAGAREVCQMKSILKMIAVLAVAAGILALAAAFLCRRKPDAADYITLYGGPDENDA